jgi:uncharacterized protein (TIRG00374 family)
MEERPLIKILNYSIKIIISAALIVTLYYLIDFKMVFRSISGFDSIRILVLCLIYIIGIIARTVRWKQIIEQNQKIQFKLVFRGLVFGYMINNLVPAKIGELARAEYLKQKTGGSRSYYLGTVIIERALDIVIVLLLFMFSVILNQKCQTIFIHNIWLFVILLGCLAMIGYFFLSKESKYLKIFPLKIRDGIGKIITSASFASNFIRNRERLLRILSSTILIWSLTLISMIVIINGLGIQIPYFAYFFVIAAGVFGMVIPSTSGGIGVYHAIATAALVLFNVSSEKALAYSVIAHAFDFFPSIILGVVLLFKENIPIRSLLKVK